MTAITPFKNTCSPDLLPTVNQALVWAAASLNDAFISDFRLSAEVLMAAVLESDRTGLILAEKNRLSENQWSLFQSHVFRRARQEPVAYITGHKEFWSLDFVVNPSVLIPRPETELLLEESLKWISQRKIPFIVVELGTGSGAVSVSLAKTLSKEKPLSILATDISLAALQTASGNARRHAVEEAVAFIQGDWLKPFSAKRQWIDLLISNPPYISVKEIFALPPTVRDYEPIRALKCGPDGLEAIRIILNQSGEHLKKGGQLLLEIGETQGSALLELARTHKFIEPQILKDYSGKDRIFSASYYG
jgi:release factor glutamine methyltransferase